MKSGWFCSVTYCGTQHKLILPSPQVDGGLSVLRWGVKCVQIWAKIIPLCDILHPSPWKERMAPCGNRVYCMNPLPLSPLAPTKHWASPTSPCSCCTTDSNASLELAGPLLASTVSWPEEMVHTVLTKPTKLSGNFSPEIMIQIYMSP